MLFDVRLLSAVVVAGRRWPPGCTLQADAAGAAELIRTGAGVLTADAELPRLVAALARLDDGT